MLAAPDDASEERRGDAPLLAAGPERCDVYPANHSASSCLLRSSDARDSMALILEGVD